MRLVFFLLLLLLVNLVLLLMMQAARQSAAEPERLARQINASRVTLMDAAGRPPAAPAAPSAIAEGNAPAVPAPPADTPLSVAGTVGACIEIGDFNTQTAASFEQDLSRLSHTGLPQRRVAQPAPSQLVYLPPLRSEAEADRRLAQLRKMGFTDSAVIRDDPARRWGISLGRFTRSDLADAHLEKLRGAGVQDARIVDYPPNSTRYVYRLSGVDGPSRARLAAAAAHYSGVTMRRCP
jgi:hypothetical protein